MDQYETKSAGAEPAPNPRSESAVNPPPYSASGPVHPPPHYAPQMVGMAVQPGIMGATVVPVMVAQQVGPNPVTMICKSCHHEIVTRVESKSATKTHIFALILCMVGCWPCVCIPYCMDSCKNAEHYCPNCNAYIGSYNN